MQPTFRAPPPIAFALAVAIALLGPGAVAADPPALGYDDARHLLGRTGFGPSEAEVRAYAPLTRDAAVTRLLAEARTRALTPPPASAIAPGPLRPSGEVEASAEARKAFVRQQQKEALELRAWWVGEMLATPSPLTERMTLFWHNHFVSAQPKVRVSRLMYRQNVTLRAHALGNFSTLLHAIAKDPAMLVYLDGVRNRKGSPNENFAREVMELFTLGEGRYTEQDVKEAARAFTGWSVDRETGAFVFRPFLHDGGVKTVLGTVGRFDGDAVLDILLARPETAEYLTAKLWREFVSPEPDAKETRRIAARFRESGYDIRVALRLILTCDAFYAPVNRGVLVKSPIDFVVGTLHTLEIRPDRPLPFAIAAAGIGQNLFSPPNVKGWPGGETWINTTTLLARKQFVDRLTRADEMPARLAMAATTSAGVEDPGMGPGTGGESDVARASPSTTSPDGQAARARRVALQMERGLSGVHFDSAHWIAQFPGATPVERAAWAQRLLVPIEPQKPADLTADPLALVRGLVLDAAFELK
jgi:uncharacterized protein (DUF1800 family)